MSFVVGGLVCVVAGVAAGVDCCLLDDVGCLVVVCCLCLLMLLLLVCRWLLFVAC